MKKGKRTEKKIIETAIDLFVRNGYHGTPLQAITDKVGLSKGAFYSHFESKADLLHKILDKFKTEYLDEMMRNVTDYDGDAVSKIHRLISFNAKFGDKNIGLLLFLAFLSHELNADSDFELGLRNLYREYQKFISDLIRQGIKEKLFQQDLDPDLAALTFLAVNDGFLHHYVMNRYHLDGVQFARMLRRVFLKGIMA
jgi:AcrR family transcriptional regulator